MPWNQSENLPKIRTLKFDIICIFFESRICSLLQQIFWSLTLPISSSCQLMHVSDSSSRIILFNNSKLNSHPTSLPPHCEIPEILSCQYPPSIGIRDGFARRWRDSKRVGRNPLQTIGFPLQFSSCSGCVDRVCVLLLPGYV